MTLLMSKAVLMLPGASAAVLPSQQLEAMVNNSFESLAAKLSSSALNLQRNATADYSAFCKLQGRHMQPSILLLKLFMSLATNFGCFTRMLTVPCKVLGGTRTRVLSTIAYQPFLTWLMTLYVLHKPGWLNGQRETYLSLHPCLCCPVRN